MTTVDLSILADRVRAELVGRGHPATAIHDATGDDTVLVFHAKRAADAYLAVRLGRVAHRFEHGPAGGDMDRDARVALGEFETFLSLHREEAA